MIQQELELVMSLIIDLPNDVQQTLEAEARSHGTSIDKLVVSLLQEKYAPKQSAMQKITPFPVEQWLREYRAWTASHRTYPVIADDSRESIYAGRGE
jgi:hypothetical protein